MQQTKDSQEDLLQEEQDFAKQLDKVEKNLFSETRLTYKYFTL